MVNESCEAPFLFTLFHIVKLLLILTNLLLFSEYSDKFILSEYFLLLDFSAQICPFCAVYHCFHASEADFRIQN